ncbi:MAG: redoxin domain-containing protein [Pirellulales bacterium]
MRNPLVSLTGLVVLALTFATPAAGAAPAPDSALGAVLDAFSLADANGKQHQLSDYAQRKVIVLAFVGTECPLARLYAPRLADLEKKYEAAGVTFLAVDSNAQDNITELKNFARVHGIEFPILKDLNHVLADRLHAARTPSVYVLDDKRVVRYQGRIDDQYGQQTTPVGTRVSYQLREPRRQDLALALDELLAGQNVSVASTEPAGCLIGRRKETKSDSDVTYTRQISRLLNNHCVSCHREGQIGPFPLASYEDAAGWAEMIGEVVAQRRMPPWHADPQHGKFANDARLSDDELQLIARWVAAGAPEGDRSELPEPPQFTAGWMIPEPDQIVHMPKEFAVPAQGTVDYQNFVVDPGWKEDKWVTAMEPRPGNPSVVHHIVMYVVPPRGVNKYFSADLPLTQLDWFSSFAPGLRPAVLPEGTARYIPAGSKLIFQMHYTPNGAAQTDRSYVGIKFADPKTVKREIAVQHSGTHDFLIPAHAENHQVESSYTFEHDSLLWSVSPHMHLRGKDFRYTLVYPDGREEVILHVPQYDFGWQTTYTLAEPMRVPKGARLNCVAHFDNSENNLNNPDPSKDVRYGPQTWEEMCYGWFEICLADQDLTDKLAGPPRQPAAPAEAPK